MTLKLLRAPGEPRERHEQQRLDGLHHVQHHAAEGRINRGVARRLFLTDRKLGLAGSDEDHRRVPAVLAWLGRRT